MTKDIVIKLAEKLYFDLPFWKRWRIRRYYYKNNITESGTLLLTMPLLNLSRLSQKERENEVSILRKTNIYPMGIKHYNTKYVF